MSLSFDRDNFYKCCEWTVHWTLGEINIFSNELEDAHSNLFCASLPTPLNFTKKKENKNL